MHFIYVKVPVAHESAHEQHLLHERLGTALVAQRVGEILSWGASLGDLQQDGLRPLRFHRVDIEADDLPACLAVLRHTLAGLDSSLGTEIHYTLDDSPQQDTLRANGWSVASG